MLDIGGWELLIIVALAIVVVGPKELPGALRTVVMWIRRARELAREFQSGIDSFIQETELDQVKTGIETVADPRKGVRSIGNCIKEELEDAFDPTEDFFDDDDEADGIAEEDFALAEQDRLILEDERKISEPRPIEEERASDEAEDEASEGPADEEEGLAANREPPAPSASPPLKTSRGKARSGTKFGAKSSDTVDESA